VAEVADLLTEVTRFRTWASEHFPGRRLGEWECDYDHWDDFYAAVLNHVAASEPEAWSGDEMQAVLYSLARDNEREHIAEVIRTRYPATLVALANAALVQSEPDARWQLADQLGHLGHRGDEVERSLLCLALDETEYVRRRALGALVRVGSPAVEQLALDAWHRPDEHQEWARMKALYCLYRIGSPHLERLLTEAEQDERQHLRQFARRISECEAIDE
jgi:hypothetical protein